MGARAATLSVLLLVAAGCRNSREIRARIEEPFPKKLSEWRLFVGQPASLQPNHGLIPFDINSPLVSDYANKHRFVWMPAGTAAVYHETDAFEFPVGTILSKTFAYPAGGKERLLETRLLVHAKSGWIGLPYVWNEQQTEATLEIAPDPVHVEFTRPAGNHYTLDYMIPNVNQCKNCHESDKIMKPIGPKARQLNKTYAYPDGSANQLAYWTKIGYLKGAPAPEQAPRLAVWDDPSTGSLDERARAYFDINCAHCHNPAGPANTSGLSLGVGVIDRWRLGLCKVPVATGRGSGGLLFSVVPGRPDESILVHRLESAEPKIMMPELGRTLVHAEGVALIRDWVTSLEGDCALRN